MDISSVPHAADAEHRMIYEPADALGFTAWTDCFDYQNGRLGLSFKEIRRAHDAAFVPPRLEMGEAIGAPVSYCSAECGSADTVSERVYMASDDGGEHWYETGRCPLAEGSFLNAGFADVSPCQDVNVKICCIFQIEYLQIPLHIVTAR